MANSKKQDFEKYIDDRNGEAAFSRLGLAFGYSDQPLRDYRADISNAIHQILGEECADMDEARRVSLRDILMASMASFLHNKDREPLSMIDVETLGLTDPSHVRRFLLSHGIDLDQKSDREYSFTVFKEAVEFFNDQVAISRKRRVHKDLAQYTKPDDIYRVFQTAAGAIPGYARTFHIPTACALLRIAMVIDYVNKDPRMGQVDSVEKHLKSKINRHIRRGKDTERDFYYDSGYPGDIGIPLSRVEIRRKEKARVVAKLLHKPTNRIDEVLDLLGLRFITQHPVQTLQLIHYMFFCPGVEIFPSMFVRIPESKQSLLNSDALRSALRNPEEARQLFSALATQTHSRERFVSTVIAGHDNPHSSPQYRAIHLTVDLPIHGGYFPVEFQFVDLGTMNDNFVAAPHDDYVERQARGFRRRVLNGNLKTGFERKWQAEHGGDLLPDEDTEDPDSESGR